MFASVESLRAAKADADVTLAAVEDFKSSVEAAAARHLPDLPTLEIFRLYPETVGWFNAGRLPRKLEDRRRGIAALACGKIQTITGLGIPAGMFKSEYRATDFVQAVAASLKVLKAAVVENVQADVGELVAVATDNPGHAYGWLFTVAARSAKLALPQLEKCRDEIARLENCRHWYESLRFLTELNLYNLRHELAGEFTTASKWVVENGVELRQADADKCTMAVAVKTYHATAITIRRHIRDRKLHDLRPKRHKANDTLLLSHKELAVWFTKRG
jgi:hypothetical protein